MKNASRVLKLTNRIYTGLAVMAVAGAYALPAVAALPFSQTPGWFKGDTNPATTTVLWTGTGTQPRGGVDFYGPLPANPVPPPDTFSTIGWGCQTGSDDPTTCAAYSAFAGTWFQDPLTAVLAVTLSDPFGQLSPSRSALRVTGNSGVHWTSLRCGPTSPTSTISTVSFAATGSTPRKSGRFCGSSATSSTRAEGRA